MHRMNTPCSQMLTRDPFLVTSNGFPNSCCPIPNPLAVIRSPPFLLLWSYLQRYYLKSPKSTPLLFLAHTGPLLASSWFHGMCPLTSHWLLSCTGDKHTSTVGLKNVPVVLPGPSDPEPHSSLTQFPLNPPWCIPGPSGSGDSTLCIPSDRTPPYSFLIPTSIPKPDQDEA